MFTISSPNPSKHGQRRRGRDDSLEDFAKKLKRPRAAWMMVPAAAVDPTLNALIPFLERDDAVIDGGNSYYLDDLRRAAELKPKGVHYVDAGTSGGVWGSERGYCLMIGGEESVVRRLDPFFAALAPGIESRHARPVGTRSSAPLNTAICDAVRAAPAISSRWSTTASNTASWPPMRKA